MASTNTIFSPKDILESIDVDADQVQRLEDEEQRRIDDLNSIKDLPNEGLPANRIYKYTNGIVGYGRSLKVRGDGEWNQWCEEPQDQKHRSAQYIFKVTDKGAQCEKREIKWILDFLEVYSKRIDRQNVEQRYSCKILD